MTDPKLEEMELRSEELLDLDVHTQDSHNELHQAATRSLPSCRRNETPWREISEDSPRATQIFNTYAEIIIHSSYIYRARQYIQISSWYCSILSKFAAIIDMHSDAWEETSRQTQ